MTQYSYDLAHIAIRDEAYRGCGFLVSIAAPLHLSSSYWHWNCSAYI